MKFPYLEAKARLVRIMGTFDLATGHGDTMDELLDSLESELRDVLGHYRKALKREWQSLTDEEIEAIGKDDKVLLAQFHTSVKAIDEMKDPTAQIMNLVIRQQGFNFAKAIEAKLKEKNGG